MAHDAARPAPWDTTLIIARRKDGTWVRLHEQLSRRRPARQKTRARTKRGHSGQPVGQDDGKRGPHGYDAGKKINGRKRYILVDTLGLLIAVVVHPANVQDRDGARAGVWCGSRTASTCECA
ncbi:MAG: transposase [Byssovorax sp.]